MSPKMEATVYLTVRKDPRYRTKLAVPKVTKTKPTLEANEIAVKVNLSIDQSVFEKLVPNINIDIKEEHIITQDVTADLENNHG